VSNTKAHYAEAEYLQGHLLHADKQLIWQIQSLTEKAHVDPVMGKQNLTALWRDLLLARLALELKVQPQVADALACLEIA
jgi:hypothetical protein